MTMKNYEAESLTKEIIEECGDCDVCRYLMDETCFFFPELFRLWDKEKQEKKEITKEELRHLLKLCHFCALCPCSNIRAKIIKAKTALIEKEGIRPSIFLMENVEIVWRIMSSFAWNKSVLRKPLDLVLKKIMNIHPERKIPKFPKESFIKWAKKENITKEPLSQGEQKVAYFVGCTGKFLFPEVPKAFVSIMQKLKIPLYIFDQHCCGMPAFLEGDRKLVLKWLRSNMDRWSELVSKGYDIVCSCSTCAFFIKEIIPSGAVYSPKVQEIIGAQKDEIKVPLGRDFKSSTCLSLSKKLYEKILVDEDYFSVIDPLERLRIAKKTFDAGEYLLRVLKSHKPLFTSGAFSKRMVYFAPCHQREQKIGKPYLEIFTMANIAVEEIQKSMYCCGLGGIMGFKKDYHLPSISIGERLAKKLEEFKPEIVITDCLSCRIQLNQLTTYSVLHPLEIIRKVMNS